MRALCPSMGLTGLLIIAGLAGCGIDPLPPILRIEHEPALVCRGAGPQALSLTAILGDETRPPSFSWDVYPAPLEVLAGGRDQDAWVMSVSDLAPVSVALTVTVDGVRGGRETLVPLGATTLSTCAVDADCAPGEVCVGVAGQRVCTADRTCLDDTYCPCLRCGATDDGRMRCLPR